MRNLVGGTVLLLTLSLVGLTGLPTASAQTKAKDPPVVKGKEKPADPPKIVEKAPAATGLTIELYKDSAGEFRFRVEDADGTKLAMASKGHKTKEDCEKVIARLKADLGKAKMSDTTKGDGKAK